MECGSAKRTRLDAQEAIRTKEKTDKKAADQTKIEALAAANRKRAQEDTDKKAIHQTKLALLVKIVMLKIYATTLWTCHR